MVAFPHCPCCTKYGFFPDACRVHTRSILGAHLREIAGSTPDHRDKAGRATSLLAWGQSCLQFVKEHTTCEAQ